QGHARPDHPHRAAPGDPQGRARRRPRHPDHGPLDPLTRHDGGVSSRRGLDPIDEAIVRELAQDARRSYADIGAAVSLSAPAVKRRVDRLRDSGIIHSFTVELDHAALGWETEAYVEVFCSGSTSPETMRVAIETYPEVVSASTVTGDVDLLL